MSDKREFVSAALGDRLTEGAKRFCVSACLLAATACGGGDGSPTSPTARPDLTVTATTRTAGNLSGATVTLSFHGNGASAAATGTDRATQVTNNTGAATFASLDDGWYSVAIQWTVGTTTRTHSALETHSGCLVAFFSNRTALAQCDPVKLPPSRSVNFVFDN